MIIFPPLISVLLTSYNRPEMVKDAIESVLDQTYQKFELIILDDNSDKKTQKVLSQYLDNPKIVYYNSHIKEKDRMKVCPYARQINVGLKMAKGKLISYLCDDDLYISNRLERMVHFLRRHPMIKVCYGRQRVIDNRNYKKTGLQFMGIRSPDRILRDPFHRVDHCSVMHYKSCIGIVGNWDTESFDKADAFFWRKLGKKFPFYPILEVLDIHRVHEGCFQVKLDKNAKNRKLQNR